MSSEVNFGSDQGQLELFSGTILLSSLVLLCYDTTWESQTPLDSTRCCANTDHRGGPEPHRLEML